MIPYGRQTIDDADIAAVVEVLKSDWLTTGPKVAEFEAGVAKYVDAKYAVAVNSGTAALHAMMAALEIGPGDEVIVPTLTFAATANSVVFQGGTPVFVDVKLETLLIDPAAVEAAITPKTRAIIAVDYAGQPCEYTRLQAIANKHGVTLVSDGCHALGAKFRGKAVGNITTMTAFSFHPVKPITTGEGGMITTNDKELADKMRTFRAHGIKTDAHQREKQGTWFYEMQSLGYNYRICDIQCALGIQQLTKLDGFTKRRQEIAALYDDRFAGSTQIIPLRKSPEVSHAYHLYVIKLRGLNRAEVYSKLREQGIGTNVHYVPVHLHPFYQQKFGTRKGRCPVAEAAYEQMLSLPVFPGMSNADVETVVETLKSIVTQQRMAA